MIAARITDCRLRVRAAGGGRIRIRVDFSGDSPIAENLLAQLRTLPELQELRYEQKP